MPLIDAFKYFRTVSNAQWYTQGQYILYIILTITIHHLLYDTKFGERVLIIFQSWAFACVKPGMHGFVEVLVL